jgi:uncharacterized protein (DUF2252 family)
MTQHGKNGMDSIGCQASSPRRDRYLAGKALRLRVPRESHAACPAPWERDAVALLREWDRGRIASLVPKRYERMAKTAFGFLRGAAAVMAADLAGLPVAGIPVQACGDCHVKNFGAFTSPEGRLLFDINDFDETLPDVDFTFDLKRLTASVAVLARDRTLLDASARKLAAAAARSYRRFMLELHEEDPTKIWRTRMEVRREAEKIADPRVRAVMTTTLEKTRKKRAQDDNFPHYAIENGVARITDHEDLIVHLDESFDLETRALLARYPESLLPERGALLSRYTLRDTAFKVVGIGSVGTYCMIGLYLSPDEEPLYLQIKEARASVLSDARGSVPDAPHRGRAIVGGQRALQAATDTFLGWTDDPTSGRQFYVRQLKQRRLDDIFADVFEGIGKKHEQAAIGFFAELCGRTLARAHARTRDAAILAGYMGRSDALDEALASFAMAYADNTNYDHARLQDALDPVTGLPTR